MMFKRFLISSLCLVLLAACGANSTPTSQRTNQPPNRLTSAPPNAAPTQQLTPPGLPSSGFPLLAQAYAGQIVFSNGDGDIYVIDPKPNAQSKKVITSPNNKGFVQEPAWSPDGKQIVYTYLVPFDTSGLPSQDLLAANADGTNSQTVIAHQVSGETFSMPTFSTDGRFLYYSHTTPIFKDKTIVSATVKLERYELATKKVTLVADDSSLVAMNPDGKRIAYVKTDPDTFQQNLFVADLDGKNAQNVVPGNALGGGLHAPKWTRDGKRILFAVPNFFASKQPSNHHTSWLVRLFDGLLGVQVAEAHGPPWDFWIVDADGKNMQRVTEIGEDMPYASYSPDGKQFAFMGLAGIYVLDADGKNIHWLIRDGGHGRLDWKP